MIKKTSWTNKHSTPGLDSGTHKTSVSVLNKTFIKAETGYGRLDTAKSLQHSLWSSSRSRSPKLKIVSEYI